MTDKQFHVGDHVRYITKDDDKVPEGSLGTIVDVEDAQAQFIIELAQIQHGLRLVWVKFETEKEPYLVIADTELESLEP